MILFGLILIILALAGGAFLFIGTSSLSDKVDITVLGITVSLPPLALVVAGALAVLLLWLGWAVLRAGTKRSTRQRRDAKEQSRLAKEQDAAKEKEWAAERERVAREQEQNQATADEKLRDQRLATETARQRAEVAERRNGEGSTSDTRRA